MAFQSTVPSVIPSFVPGNLAFEGPTRAQPVRLNSADAANNVFGRALRVVGNAAAQDATNVVAGAGGTTVFVGILTGPHQHTSYGTAAGGTLAASFVLPNGEIAEATSMGEVAVVISTDADVGDIIWSHDTTGVLAATAPGTGSLSNHTLVPNTTVERFPLAATGGLVVIKLNN